MEGGEASFLDSVYHVIHLYFYIHLYSFKCGARTAAKNLGSVCRNPGPQLRPESNLKQSPGDLYAGKYLRYTALKP